MPGDSLVPPEVDFDRLLASLKDLSELVVDNDTHVTPKRSGTRLGVLEPIPLKLYRNGIMMFDGPFRPFHDPSTQVGVGVGVQGGETGLYTLRPLWCYLLCSPLLVGASGTQLPLSQPTPMAPRSMQNLQGLPSPFPTSPGSEKDPLGKPVVQGLPSRQDTG